MLKPKYNILFKVSDFHIYIYNITFLLYFTIKRNTVVAVNCLLWFHLFSSVSIFVLEGKKTFKGMLKFWFPDE